MIESLAEPVLLDEWQDVPEVLAAVKRACDAEPQPGRFILAGSVRAETKADTWPGTGRVARITTHGRHKVDVVAEFDAQRLVAFEIKATAAPAAADARHLAWLRDHTGEQFIAGVVLHTGPGAFPLGDRLWALPITSLWA